VCGIVGYVGKRDATPVLIEGLHRLEYRGYDSAGLAVVHRGRLQVTKTPGRVADLRSKLPQTAKATTGIGHTRWATHGEPNEVNAHPHTDTAGRIAVVHNGIFENAEELRDELTAAGVTLISDTDTETVAHMIAAEFAADGRTSLGDAVCRALARIEGAYGLVVMDTKNPDQLVVARNGSPVVLGVGENEMFVASDVAALVRYTRQVVYLEDGEVATLRPGDYQTRALTSSGLQAVPKTPTTVDADADDYELGAYADYMSKEIHEQPQAIRRALRGRLDERFSTAHLGGINLDARELRSIRQVKFLGCGSAYYAGQMGAGIIEELARIPADAEPASEFRYRSPVVDPNTLYIAVSQSGETYDTMAAVQEVKRKGGRAIGVINTVGSSIARECDGGVYLHAGPEVSVTSTKTFTATATVFALLALHLARIRDLSPADGERIGAGLHRLPGQIADILAREEEIAALAKDLARYPGMFFIGRVRGYAVAREGAQKLKEVSYLHAEAYPASELKHGPLALVGPGLPTVAIVPDDELREKNLGTLGEIKARQGKVLLIGHSVPPGRLADDVIAVPRNEPELDPILLSVPLQLLAYHAAVALGNDVDKPRNLAKSVTVE
jgi:glutamine---fructose-6-phosphate transaminase (isomerizing)